MRRRSLYYPLAAFTFEILRVRVSPVATLRPAPLSRPLVESLALKFCEGSRRLPIQARAARWVACYPCATAPATKLSELVLVVLSTVLPLLI
jgi:hypothetical protein